MAYEVLDVEPGEVAGLSNAVKEVAHDGYNIAAFVSQHCTVSGQGFGGRILEPLAPAFSLASGAFKDRMGSIASATGTTSTELNRAAWMYHNVDQQNYAALNAASTDINGVAAGVETDRETGQVAKAYVNAVAYPKPEEIKLDPPSSAPPELADIIAETSGVVGDVNEAIKNVTRMAGNEVNVLETILSPITVNWNELRRIGESYKLAGNSMEKCGVNLEDGVRRVGPKWNGKAAISFEDWAQKQITAMKWEGPVGRIISDVCNELADSIRDGVRKACEKLKEMVMSYVDFRNAKNAFKQLVKRIPGIGTAWEIYDLATKIWEIIDMIKTIITAIEEARDRLKEFLEFVTNPVGRGKEWLEQKLEPYTSRIDDAARYAAQLNDIRKISQYEDTVNRPKEAYEIGSGRQPWEDAV